MAEPSFSLFRMQYFQHIRTALRSIWQGLVTTFPHLRSGGKDAVTRQYPMEQMPVPDIGRYRLHLEADDCIVCDKCARICPVDCIDIQGFKATEDLGTTSDGTKKRLHLPVFDIDMAKCCYCGLCTTVCPTECLTMTKVFDFSETDRAEFVYHFGMLSPEDAAEKRALLDASKTSK